MCNVVMYNVYSSPNEAYFAYSTRIYVMCMSLTTSDPCNAFKFKHSQLTLNAPRFGRVYRIECLQRAAGLHKFMDFYYISGKLNISIRDA